jgi:RNA polymerase sigma factor (sigma-70 family)
LDEHRLIQRIKSGDTESFRYLYRLHSQSAWQLAISICKNKLNAEEAVQSSFIAAFKYIRGFKGESSFKTWLLRIVFNEAIKVQKLEKKFRWQEISNENEDSNEYLASAPNVMEQKNIKEQVAKTLGQMSEKEAVILNLFYLEEQSVKETADILGYSESNVKVLLHRARKNFKFNYEKL